MHSTPPLLGFDPECPRRIDDLVATLLDESVHGRLRYTVLLAGSPKRQTMVGDRAHRRSDAIG